MTDPATIIYRHFSASRLVRSKLLSRDGADVYLKLELELPTGSFKVRGALYALARRLEKGSVSEVVAASTGNHGAAVAWAGKELGVRARIFLPRDSNPTKVDNIRSLGAAITEHGSLLSDAIGAAERYASETGAFLLADAADSDVPIGAGTIGSEIVEQLPDVDVIYVPVGDTALIRGIASAAKAKRPSVRILAVQSTGAPAYYRSWKSGKIETTKSADTIADGLATTQPLRQNVDAIRTLVDDFELVTDDELLAAIALMMKGEKMTIEPAAAASVAAFTRAPTRGNVVLIISGSNIAPAVLDAARRLG
jgi:threonine dehydratase